MYTVATWVDLGCQVPTHPLSLSLKREGGENMLRKLADKDREFTYQYCENSFNLGRI